MPFVLSNLPARPLRTQLLSFCLICAGCLAGQFPAMAQEQPKPAAQIQADTKFLVVPLNRSSLVVLPNPMAEVMVANPDIADVHAHNANNLTIVAKQLGQTNVRVFNKRGELMREFYITVSYDLPAIRRALKNFLPNENVGVEMVNTSVALTGQISNASVADKAIKIVRDFIQSSTSSNASPSTVQAQLAEVLNAKSNQQQQMASNNTALQQTNPDILNLMQVISGQQVMLRVRVGEINREALKNLGVDLNLISSTGEGLVSLGTGGGIASLVSPATTSEISVNPGVFLLPGGRTPTDTRGVLTGRWQPNGSNGSTVAGLLKALEQDGLFKLLAEPNLVAVSGEEAEFLAGGEIPIPVVQGGTTVNNISIEYKPFGVAVRFTPFVLSENRVRVAVQPEVSEVSSENAVQVSGFSIPSISTRRAKTTVELAPGESFMIAGLIKDQMRANIEQLPGVKELPVLGALFRSTEFQRNETELVIAVTPYVVDPVKGSDVKMPTDNFKTPSQVEMFFFGALGAMSGSNASTPGIEGPTGFMVD